MTTTSDFIKKIKRFINRISFINSGHYWNKRYLHGGNSGTGSYGHLAEFKAEIINTFVKENNVESVIEFGCGDGNQLKLLDLPSYTGFDVSKKSIEICKELYKDIKNKNFKLLKEFQNEKADLVLSLDVIFHLIEDDIYDKHMTSLFSSSKKYVIIYSSNTDLNMPTQPPHFKNRAFTTWIEEKFPSFELLEKIPNKYPYNGTEETSVSDFYFYGKRLDIERI